MKKINENVEYLKYKKIDPLHEENWDEYEISQDDKFYLFLYNEEKDDVYIGVGSAIFKNDDIYLNILTSDDPDILNTNVKLSKSIIDDLNKKNFSIKKIKIKSLSLISIVNDFKLKTKYKNIHEIVRKYLYNNIKTFKDKISTLDQELDSLESKVITLKSSIKTTADFPNLNDLDIDENDYIIIKLIKNSETNDLIFGIYETKKNSNGSVSLINKENGTTDQRLEKQSYQRLIDQNYLLLKNTSTSVFIFKNIPGAYEEIQDYIIQSENKSITSKIETYRKDYRSQLDEINKLREELSERRKKYLNFNFSNLMEKIKNL